MGTPIGPRMYYCPKCDKTLKKERVESVDLELREKFGVDRVSSLRCPVCGTDFIDLEKVAKGGERFARKGP